MARPVLPAPLLSPGARMLTYAVSGTCGDCCCCCGGLAPLPILLLRRVRLG